MLLVKSSRFAGIKERLAAVGRTAFSNYILQTVICVTLFNGFGFFGRMERSRQIGIVLAIWSVQLLLSPLWLRKFCYGPLEWLWRSLTYGQRERFLRP